MAAPAAHRLMPASRGVILAARRRVGHISGIAGRQIRRMPDCSRANQGNVKETEMTARIMILNGPNLNFLGIREPHIYGSTTLKEIEASCHELAAYLDVAIAFHQSNLEGELVGLIQSARRQADALIMNPAAYSFTSIALIDALKIFEGPKIEVHISNIHARDELHRHSITSTAVTAVICGLGPYGYLAAILAAVQKLGKLPARVPAALNGLRTEGQG
jgi:3-dehydroquinate dehydratase-2